MMLRDWPTPPAQSLAEYPVYLKPIEVVTSDDPLKSHGLLALLVTL